MRILVTGGAGFIGSNFVRHILNKYADYEVVCFDNLSYAGNLENLRDVSENSRFKFIEGDICERAAVDEAMEGTDFVINFAAQTHVDRSIMDPTDFVMTNVFGTFVLLDAAKDYGVKFIQIGTDEVYGSVEDGFSRESDGLNPTSPYAASKAAADLLVLSYVKTYKLAASIIRPSNNFGPFQYPEKVLPLFITNASEDKKLPLYGDGSNVRDWLYVKDTCEAIDLIMHKGEPGSVYNAGGGNLLTNLELTNLVLKKLEKPESMVEPVKDRPAHDKRYAMDSSKICSLGWKPKYDFGSALEETISWYKENRPWWGKIKSDKENYQAYYKRQYGKGR